jgi:ribosomal protein S18 acetylase RimI-like enzyme
MMTTDARLLHTTPGGQLRSFDVGRDLNPVADLIEECFADTLGIDGQRYIQQMRAAARNPRFLRWASSVSEYVMLPLAGFVWEEHGQIVGNLSLIPFNAVTGRIYLIANVAVDPYHRRQGIAKALTDAALDYARRRRVRKVWLHVRADNPPAIELYQSMGFAERARRTNWRNRLDYWPEEGIPGARIRQRRSAYWTSQHAWLKRLYPQELGWNIPLSHDLLQPGLRGALRRLLTGLEIRQWAVEREGQLLGVLAWQRSRSQADHLWLAAPPDGEDLAVRALLGPARKLLPAHRRVALDFPAGRAVQALEAIGFVPEQTLIWMWTNI